MTLFQNPLEPSCRFPLQVHHTGIPSSHQTGLDEKPSLAVILKNNLIEWYPMVGEKCSSKPVHLYE